MPAVMQVVSQGPQNAHLNKNPTTTIWRNRYRKYTQFAVESVEQQFQGQVGAGRQLIAPVIRSGDLIYGGEFVFRLPGLAPAGGDTYAHWTNAIAFALIRETQVDVGGIQAAKDYGESMFIWEEMTGVAQKRPDEAYGKRETRMQLIADAQWVSRLYYAPLQYWFAQYPGNALPLVALLLHNVHIKLETQQLSKLWVSGPCGHTPYALTTSKGSYAPLTDVSMDAFMYLNFVYLDQEERDRFVENDHQYLMTQVQRIVTTVVGQQSGLAPYKVQLPFAHPVFWMCWVVQQCDAINRKDLFNYEGIQGLDPVLTARIQISGQDRITEREGRYFRLIDPLRQGLNIPRKHIYSFGYGVRANIFQPQGAMNFSRVDDPSLFIKLQAGLSESVVTTYARNYNWFRVTGGMGGPTYSG